MQKWLFHAFRTKSYSFTKIRSYNNVSISVCDMTKCQRKNCLDLRLVRFHYDSNYLFPLLSWYSPCKWSLGGHIIMSNCPNIVSTHIFHVIYGWIFVKLGTNVNQHDVWHTKFRSISQGSWPNDKTCVGGWYKSASLIVSIWFIGKFIDIWKVLWNLTIYWNRYNCIHYAIWNQQADWKVIRLMCIVLGN